MLEHLWLVHLFVIFLFELKIILFYYCFQSKRMRWAGHVARMGEKRNAYRILVGKPEGKRPLGRKGVGGWTILK
jgi:hypothetical protein